jgi:hypothetical protein
MKKNMSLKLFPLCIVILSIMGQAGCEASTFYVEGDDADAGQDAVVDAPPDTPAEIPADGPQDTPQDTPGEEWRPAAARRATGPRA